MAGQDIRKRLPAGGAQPVNVSGDYIYCKFADRPISIIINGGRSGQTRVTMEAGDKYRPGPFEQFEVENPDPDRPAQIVLTVGEGDYNRQVVKGEVSVVPVLRNADGTTKPDTRYRLSMDIVPENLDIIAYEQGEIIKTATPRAPGQDSMAAVDDSSIFPGPGGFPVLAQGEYDGGYTGSWVQVDWELKTIDSGGDPINAGPPAFNNYANDVAWCPQQGFVSVYDQEVYAAASEEKDLLYTWGSTKSIYSIAYVPWRETLLLIDFDAEYWEELDAKTLERRNSGTRGGGNQSVIRADWSGERLYRLESSTLFEVDPETMEDVKEIGAVGVYNVARAAIKYDNLYGSDNIGGSLNIVKSAAWDYSTKPEFSAVKPGCEMVVAMGRPDYLPQIRAAVSVEENAGGVVVTGEVIRAALEYYFQRKAPDDYLDHIYYLELGKDENGLPIKPISTGNETMARAAITDDFKVTLPGRIALMVDSELDMGSAL